MSENLSNVPRVEHAFGAYDRPLAIPENSELTHCSAGTPGGEYLRRMWQPLCLAEELGDVPQCVRMLGEDLVLIRTRAGKVGLVEKHCSYRGASLEYGLPTDQGIQCCYHGWHVAPDGTILETPNDPDSKIKDRLCHPTYTQDTVWSIPAKSDGDDRALLRAAGSQMASLVFESAAVPPERREAFYVEHAQAICASLRTQ